MTLKFNQSLIYFGFYLCLSLTILKFELVSGVKPGDVCLTDIECDDKKTFLECDNVTQTCRCQSFSTSYFEEADGKCHSYHSEECYDYGIPCPINGGCMVWGDPNQPICRCVGIEGYLVTSNKKCAFPYGVTCTTYTDCNRDRFMFCLGSPQICTCDEMTSKYDENSDECLLKLGQTCEIEPTSQNCSTWSECKGTCQCMDGLIENGHGDCRASWGSNCIYGQPCDETNFLMCDLRPGRCVCLEGLEHNGKNQCRTGLGKVCGSELAPCNEEKFLECVETETDNNDNDNVTMACQCQMGMSENVYGECRVDVGGSCANGELCDETKNLYCAFDGRCYPIGTIFLQGGQFCNPLHDLCDPQIYLKCDSITSKCICLNESETIQDFDGNCLRRANTHCSIQEGSQGCIGNSECIQVGLEHRCLCNFGLSHSNGGRCVLEYGAVCSSNLPDLCDAENFQVCNPIDGRCNCFDIENMEFDSNREKCFIKENSQCHPDSVIECGQGLTCDVSIQKCIPTV